MPMTTRPSFGDAVRREWHELSHHEREAVISFLQGERRGRSVNELDAERRTRGDRIADQVTAQLGSWRFIIVQSVMLVFWVALNVIGWIHHWDPYPFILLNLALSFQAAYSAPIIMMSQNRQAAKDRIAAANDYEVNLHAEMDVTAIHSRLDELAGAQWSTLIRLQEEQLELLTRIEQLTREVHRLSVQSGA
jgi:uncharacterized membrane protein